MVIGVVISGNKEQMNGRPNVFPIPRISSRPALLGIELVLCILASVCNSLALPLTSAAWGAGRRRGSTSSRILSQEEKERAEVMSSRYLGGAASQSRDSWTAGRQVHTIPSVPRRPLPHTAHSAGAGERTSLSVASDISTMMENSDMGGISSRHRSI